MGALLQALGLRAVVRLFRGERQEPAAEPLSDEEYAAQRALAESRLPKRLRPKA